MLYESGTIVSLAERQVRHLEGITFVIAEVAVSDDRNRISYSIINGADQDLFSINSETGELRFIDPPRVNNPRDFDRNNIYEVRIAASDGFSSITRLIAVEVAQAAQLEPNLSQE